MAERSCSDTLLLVHMTVLMLSGKSLSILQKTSENNLFYTFKYKLILLFYLLIAQILYTKYTYFLFYFTFIFCQLNSTDFCKSPSMMFEVFSQFSPEIWSHNKRGDNDMRNMPALYFIFTQRSVILLLKFVVFSYPYLILYQW